MFSVKQYDELSVQMFERDKADRRHTEVAGEGGGWWEGLEVGVGVSKARSGDGKRGKVDGNGECGETVERSATRGQ